jgi:ABC-type sugar transport system substrate-binding protein
MIKIASLTLSAALAATGLAQSSTAAACPADGYAIPHAAGFVPAGYYPVGYGPYHLRDRYWRRHERFDRFHHRWY